MIFMSKAPFFLYENPGVPFLFFTIPDIKDRL